ncbi:hypothetical protein [Desulfosarcina sp.]|uniref:hypothetical protein n=1 Tax=Desulfosarcina sp. TaxID=2027861 RepID=UPI0029B50366|nr:hypothetical protein [Desulfosarcina sp.]MDX2454807.1 hypothetical protein [Desulfosarcina sp.]MDX2492420.1 hypothetical protein [Desulfosarcina sp.]
MSICLTVKELEARWEKALAATRAAVTQHPRTYRDLKAQAAEIIENPIDINDYFPRVEKLVDQLKAMDPCGHGSIFDIFSAHISPSSIWHIKMLRMECRDLLSHLNAFDEWRRSQHHLRMVK